MSAPENGLQPQKTGTDMIFDADGDAVMRDVMGDCSSSSRLPSVSHDTELVFRGIPLSWGCDDPILTVKIPPISITDDPTASVLPVPVSVPRSTLQKAFAPLLVNADGQTPPWTLVQLLPILWCDSREPVALCRSDILHRPCANLDWEEVAIEVADMISLDSGHENRPFHYRVLIEGPDRYIPVTEDLSLLSKNPALSAAEFEYHFPDHVATKSEREEYFKHLPRYENMVSIGFSYIFVDCVCGP